ncbi:MAG: DUF2865 domain-containing protein [Beijerinckiaceae bacterium]
MVLGIVGVMTLTPSGVAAFDDAGIRAVQMQDAQQRRTPRAAAPAHYDIQPAPRRRERYEMFQPIVRSFAPEPRPSRALPAPIQFGYGGEALRTEPVRDRFTTPAPQFPSLKDAVEKRGRRAADESSLAEIAGPMSTRTVCVRMCDGFHFPIGVLQSAGDYGAHAATCKAACPAAEVRLFTLAPGATSIDQAIGRDARSYMQMATAHAYRTARDQSCTCQSDRKGNYVSLLRDITLKAGDTVVTNGGAKVFRGARQWPYRGADFADFRKAPQISQRQKRQIDSMTAVSLNVELLRPFTVAKMTPVREDVAAVQPTLSSTSRVIEVDAAPTASVRRAQTRGFTPVSGHGSLQIVQNRVNGFVIR